MLLRINVETVLLHHTLGHHGHCLPSAPFNPTLVQSQQSNSRVPCRVSHWSPWAACTDNVEAASRTITQAGADCLPLKRTRACASKPVIVQTFRDESFEDEDDADLVGSEPLTL